MNGYYNRITGNGGESIPESLEEAKPAPSQHIKLPFLCAYYKGTYYAKNDQEDRFVPLSERALCRRLQHHNIEATSGALEYITQHFSVDYVGPIAGYPTGICMNNGYKCLVTTIADEVKAQKGEWQTIKQLVKGMLREQQTLFFFAVMQCALWRLLRKATLPIQAMAFVGVPNVGKTFVQRYIITPLLGRATNPIQYILGQTQFSKDIGGAEHLMISDEHIHFTTRARNLMYDYVKQITVNSTQRVHPKGGDAHELDVRTLLTISCNEDSDRDLKVIPDLDSLLMPRIHIFRCYEDAKPMFKPSPEEKATFLKAVTDELPAFKDFLLNGWKVPKEIQDPENRFPCRAFHNPRIVTRLEGIAPENQILEIILEVLFPLGGEPCIYETRSAGLLRRLIEGNFREAVHNIVRSPRELGELLSKLRESKPEIVKLDRKSMGHNVWHMYHPELLGKRKVNTRKKRLL